MEPLLKSLRELGRRFSALSLPIRLGIAGGIGLVVLVAVAATLFDQASTYQYVFTNLTTEDGGEAAGVLKASGIPFRTEANGSALAVPASRVHEARLLLASSGLPRGGGIGFEIFDRGDLGVSEFTQKVNLRRATEGELARTVSRLAAVRTARVHLTLPEKGLYRDEDKKASAAVVLNLQPGRVMQERELAGIRHLVASAVAGLPPDAVTIVDGRGTVLAGDRSDATRVASAQREVEGQLEQRIVELLEPAVGAGAVVAKVTAALDTTEVETTADVYDPDGAAVRSTRKTVELVTGEGANGGGVAGAAANQPLAPTAGAAGGARGVQSSREDETKNYEVTKKVTRTVARQPRVARISAAVLVDGVGGKPRSEAEMRRLAELAKHAMGFDERRGDRFDISSAPFAKASGEGSQVTVPFWSRPEIVRIVVMGLVALVVLAAVATIVLRGRKRAAAAAVGLELLRPGAKVAELEAALAKGQPGALPPAPAETPALPDKAIALRDKARELGKTDPARAAHLLKAWVASDSEAKGAMSRG